MDCSATGVGAFGTKAGDALSNKLHEELLNRGTENDSSIDVTARPGKRIYMYIYAACACICVYPYVCMHRSRDRLQNEVARSPRVSVREANVLSCGLSGRVAIRASVSIGTSVHVPAVHQRRI